MSRESLERYWASVPRYRGWKQIIEEMEGTMNCIIVKGIERNGKVIGATYEQADLSADKAREISHAATVVSLEGVGLNNMTTFYEGGRVSQTLMTPEQRELLETRALECARRAAQYDGRNGWIS